MYLVQLVIGYMPMSSGIALVYLMNMLMIQQVEKQLHTINQMEQWIIR
ncbi:hypothetical protein BvCmsOUNP013_00804 [Escherichia coli]|nr:hypothetical protein BvCmsOUNP013_00804 [Escherichia coli]